MVVVVVSDGNVSEGENRQERMVGRKSVSPR